jgi:ubiquinone/menaquinone biosynthesis C-methylase UbiE
MRDKRFPASNASKLDDPGRNEWLPTAEVLALLAVRPEEVIADVGAGTGYFSLPLAKAAGAVGRVYAVDAQAEMLLWIKGKLNQGAFTNIELIHAEAAQTSLPDSSCDLFFMANIWHEIEDQAAVLQESLRVLKPGGRIAILDWRTDVEATYGPPLAHRISASNAKMVLDSVGFFQVSLAEVGRYSWLAHGEKRQ